MNRIKNFIIILILLILIIIISIYLLKLNVNKEENIDNIVGDIGNVKEITNKLQDVSDITTFKTVEQCIQQYYNILNNESSIFYQKNENGDYVKTATDDEIAQLRLNLLSEEYIKNNNINVSNINRFVNDMDEQGTVVVLKMKELVDINVEKYLAEAILINYDNKVLDRFYISVNIDNINKTYSIEPILNEYNDINEIEMNNTNEQIKSNGNNQYNRKVYNYEEIAKSYFLTYKRLAMSNPEILYSYMNDEYKSKRFGNQSNFINYVAENKNEIEWLRMTEYLVNNKKDVTQFVCKDQYGNLYIFDEKLPMQFSLILDTYTIMSEKFKESYESANNEEKVQMNIDKFVQMINRQDYKTSYNCISEGFKNNYFENQEEFENYIKNNFFEYNKFQFKNIEKKGSNIYVATVQLTDLTGQNSEIREINIIMQLNDGINFEMSFGM